jgi:long-chain acyl-CoA synthetase
LAAAGEPGLDWLETKAAEVSPDDPAFIVYTSGPTGKPKGALVSHGKHLAATYNLIDIYPTLASREHSTVVYLPLCHVLGRDIAVTLPLISNLVPHYGESIEDFTTTLFEVAPTILFTVPRYLQKFASHVLVGIINSSPLKRGLYQLALKIGRRQARRRWDGTVNVADRLVFALCRFLVFRPILNKLGFDELEVVVSGGAPLPTDTMALWHMYGVNVVEMYGQTETAGGIVSGQRGPFPRPGDVGVVPDGWDVKLGDEGEVLVKSPYLFEGYWNNDEATESVFRDDGYLRTGDVGEWRDGALKLIDRLRDFIVTLGGKTLSPSFIENLLRASPYVAEAVVFGHGRKYVTAIVEIDYDTVADWARGQEIAYTGFTSLAENAYVQELIQAEINKANAELARVEQIKAFRILPKALDPEEEGEPVTPTRKVKRNQMYERFKALIDSMYDDREERRLAEEVGGALRG